MDDASSNTDNGNCSGNDSHDWELVPSDGSPCSPVSADGQDQKALKLAPDAGEPLQMEYFGVSSASIDDPPLQTEDMLIVSSCEGLPGTDDWLNTLTLHQEREEINNRLESMTLHRDTGTVSENSCEGTAETDDRSKSVMLDKEGETARVSSCKVGSDRLQFVSMDQERVARGEGAVEADSQLKSITFDQERGIIKKTEFDPSQLVSAILSDETPGTKESLTFITPGKELQTTISLRDSLEEQQLQNTVEGEEDRKNDSPTRVDEAIARTELFGCSEIVVPSGSIITFGSECSSLSDEGSTSVETWWKRPLSVLQAGEGHGNTFWSVAVAAAVVSLLILGHRWRRSCIQNKKLKLEFDAKEKKISQLMYQLVRMKEYAQCTKQIPILHSQTTFFASFQTVIDMGL